MLDSLWEESPRAESRRWQFPAASGWQEATGGLRAWHEEVLHPRVDGLAAPERARAEAVSAHFGGAPRSGATADTAAPPAPSVALSVPPPQPAAAKKPAPAKKKEGC